MNSRLRTPALWMLVVTCVALAGGSAATAGERGDTPATNSPSRAAEEKQPDRERQKRVARAAGYVLLGIVLVGLTLIAMVVLWGRRIRRIARAPLPRQSARDELWYLRPKTNRPVSDADAPNSAGDERQTGSPGTDEDQP